MFCIKMVTGTSSMTSYLDYYLNDQNFTYINVFITVDCYDPLQENACGCVQWNHIK